MSRSTDLEFELELTEEQRNSPGIEDWVELKRIGERVSRDLRTKQF